MVEMLQFKRFDIVLQEEWQGLRPTIAGPHILSSVSGALIGGINVNQGLKRAY